METSLDHNYPPATMLDKAFPTFDTPRPLIEMAKERGFYNGNTPGNKLFGEWFYSGLKAAPQFKEGINQEKAQKAMNWAVCFMGSFAPKHEEKEAICAMIFNDCLVL